MESMVGSVPLPPMYPNHSFPISNNLLRGTGQLTWLSPKAGLITCSKPSPVTVSFQLKDFCDAGVTDFTNVLRVGFRLAFHASSPNDNNEWIANYVAPISDQDLNSGIFNESKEMDLEAIEQSLLPGSAKSQKDPYTIEMEVESLSFLLSIFQKNAVHFISLSSLHSRISNSGKEDLYRYIGSSSLKRRQFIERRSYIFYIAENDMVFLQPSEVYMAICILTGFLLSHGGVTSSDALFAFFNATPLMPLPLRESIKNSRSNFMAFLSRHPFAFAPFPSQFYVSVRRNLPYFDYSTFIKKNFPGCVYPRVSNAVPSYVGNPRGGGPIPAFGAFDHMGDGMTANYRTPTASVTPLFQEDQLVVSQKAARATGCWPNDIGYFDHQAANSAAGVTSSVAGILPLGGGAKVPLLGGVPPPPLQPIVGAGRAGANSMAAIFGVGGASAGDMAMPKMNEFVKVDVSRRPTDLALMDAFHAAAAAMPLMKHRPVGVDNATQTEFDRNGGHIDRPIGADPRCRCTCTCQWSQQQHADTHRRQSSTESLNLARTQSQVANHYGAFDSERMAAMMRQRPVSVQEQPIGGQSHAQQRMLFGQPPVAAVATTTTSMGGNGLMGGVNGTSVDALAGTNGGLFGRSTVAGGGPDHEFDMLHDSFFNHTLTAFTSNFMHNGGGSMMNGGNFLDGLDMFSGSSTPSSNATPGAGGGSSVIGQRRSAQNSTDSSESSSAAMPPIGMPTDGTPPTSSGDGLGETSAKSADSVAAANNHYDPFGSGLNFKLELSSLKL